MMSPYVLPQEITKQILLGWRDKRLGRGRCEHALLREREDHTSQHILIMVTSCSPLALCLLTSQ